MCMKHAETCNRTNLVKSFQSVALNVTEYPQEYLDNVNLLVKSHTSTYML